MAGTKGRSGGKREGAGVKSKLVDPDVLADWNAQLTRAIRQASSSMFVLRKNSFFTTAEIKRTYGKQALAQFKDWFEASKHCDQVQADVLYQELATGKISQPKFNALFAKTAFFWVWSVRSEKQSAAWRISRGLQRL